MQRSKNSSRGMQKTPNDLSPFMQKILEKAKAKGASSAIVFVDHDEGFSVDVRMGKVETISFNEDRGINLSVYFDHCKGQASSTDMSERSIDAIIDAACEIAKVSAADPCFGLADPTLAVSQFPDLDLHHAWDIKPAQAVETALACEAYALQQDARITSDGVSVSTYNFTHGFASTDGTEGFLHSSRHSISCSFIAEEKGMMQRDYDYTTSRVPEYLMPINELACSAASRTISRLNAQKVKTQKAPVLFSSRVSSSILSSFLNAISGANLYRKNTFLLDSLGQRVLPEGFTIYEEPHLLRALGSAPFDGEGVLTRNNIFVEDGCVHSYVLGSYSARRLGLETTANSGGVHNLILKAQKDAGNLSQLIKTMHKGLLITELMGQGVNGLTGDYSRGAAGFWIEQGTIQFPVEGVTIAGNLKDMLLAVQAVGSDINTNIATRCGSLLIDGMTIAGC